MLKILHVDDSEDCRELILEQIKDKFNLRIDSARSGNEAKQLLEQGQRYNIIISDFMMPDGNGSELFEYVNRHSLDSFFIFLTASADSIKIRHPRISYCIIEKPEISALYKRLREFLDPEINLSQPT